MRIKYEIRKARSKARSIWLKTDDVILRVIICTLLKDRSISSQRDARAYANAYDKTGIHSKIMERNGIYIKLYMYLYCY